MAHNFFRTGFGILAFALAALTAEATPLAITKSFGAASVAVGGTTTLTFVITNVDATPHTGVTFTDTFPAGMDWPDASLSYTAGCLGGNVPVDTANFIPDIQVAANDSCTLIINVRATTNGAKVNTTSAISSIEGGVGGIASATLNVFSPATVTTNFVPAATSTAIPSNYNFIITNPASNPGNLTGVSFTTTLPAGISFNTQTVGACGGTVSKNGPANTIALTNASIAPGASCNFSLNAIFGDTVGLYTNTITVNSVEAGASLPATASLSVEGPPTLIKAFGSPTLVVNATTSLTFTIQNGYPVPSTAIQFTDNFPPNMEVAAPNGLTGSCGGTVTAVPGSRVVTLAGGTVAAGTACSFSVNIRATTLGNWLNAIGSIRSTGGTGLPATAYLDVLDPPGLTMAFGAGSIPVGGSTSLDFSITNINPLTALNGVAFVDNLPAGLVVATPNGITGSCGAGTITATAGSGTISLSGGTIPANSSCQFSVNVTGTSDGSKVNSVSNITTTELGAQPSTASAQVNVVGAPGIAAAFGAASIPLNGTTSLTFTVSNLASSGVSGVGFTNTLPAGLVVATPNGLVNTCGAAATAVSGSSSVSLAGVIMPGGATCTLKVDVTGTTAGTKNNTSGAITSIEGGTGNSASASLMVVWNTFTGPTPSNGNATVSFTGGGPGCNFASVGFIPLSGGVGSPPAGSAPAGYTFPNDLLAFETTGCGAGATLDFTVTYATPVRRDGQYWKYGPTTATPAPHWYVLPATISGNSVAFSITDGGLGDDGGVDGAIVDAGGIGIPAFAVIGPQIPTMSEWAMLLLALMMLLCHSRVGGNPDQLKRPRNTPA